MEYRKATEKVVSLPVWVTMLFIAHDVKKWFGGRLILIVEYITEIQLVKPLYSNFTPTKEVF